MAALRSKTNVRAFLTFLGTAGARFVMMRQTRASGGIWVSSGKAAVLIDPGPGSIVRCTQSRLHLDPTRLDGILLTHRHLDHVNDVNVMIEAMTEGGMKKRGVVWCPQDALNEDTVILRYAQSLPERIEILRERSSYAIEGFRFSTSGRHLHPAETYGLRFRLGKEEVGILTDTDYFETLSESYRGIDTLIMAVVFLQHRPGIQHLGSDDAQELIRQIKPRRVFLTHFGRTMLEASPERVARRLSARTGVPVRAARDGLTLWFS